MTFLNPVYFFTLLGLIPLVAFYFLKVRPRQKPVTALFLWQAVLDQKKNTALFNRLRDLLSLLMMVLAFTAVVLALTAPELAKDQRKDLLLIIDNSASMNAVDNSIVRLDKARDIALDIIRAMNTHQQAAVAAVSMDIQYKTHFTSSPKILIDSVRQIKKGYCPFKSSALNTIRAGAGAMKNCRVILISDACNYQADANDNIELIKIGSNQENIGFISCDLCRLQTDPVQVGFYFQLASSFKRQVSTDILLTCADDHQLIKVIPVTVKPGINKPEVYTISTDAYTKWTASLDFKDALASDNTVFMALQDKHPVKIKVESETPFFLINSVNAFARTTGDLEYAADNADVVLANALTPDAEKCIVFGIKSNSDLCSVVSDELDNVLARIKVRDHPILRNCEIDSMSFIGARKIQAPNGSLVLVENSDHIPLIYLVHNENRDALIINMDTADSEFYYSAWFPILIYNSARYLMGQQNTLSSTCSIGETVQIPARQSALETTSISCADSNDILQLNGSLYGPIRQRGFHFIKNSTGKWYLGANLFSAAETMLDNSKAVDTCRALNKGWPLSLILAILALLILAFECVLYHLRKVG